MNEMSFR